MATDPVQRAAGDSGHITDQNTVHARVTGCLSVKEAVYGAAGDGATDDTTAIQAAVDAASAGCGEVWVPDGTYIVDGIRAASNVHLRLSAKATLKLKASASANATIRRPAAGNLTNFILEGGTIDGNGSNQSSSKDAIAIDVTTGSIDRLIIRNVRALNARRHGIFVAENNPSDGSKLVEGCEVDGYGLGETGFGIYFDYAPGAVCTRNTIRNEGSNPCDAIELGNAGKYICTHNTIEDSQLQFPFAADSVIAFNLLLGPRSVIQNDGNTADRVRIIGNTIISATPDEGQYAGISVVGADAVVMGNSVKVTQFRGIRTNGARPIIQGNRIETTSTSASGAAIYPETGQYARVLGNTVVGKWAQSIVIDHSDIGVGFNYLEASSSAGTNVYLANSADSGRTYTNLRIAFNEAAVAATALDRQDQNSATIRFFGNAGIPSDQVDVVATASLPAAATSNDGRVLIENAGAGNQNLIIYSQAGRYRIDGGTTF